MENYTVNINKDEINNRLEAEFTNDRGERILLWFYRQKRENSFMDNWVKNGYLKQPIEEFWWVEAYTYDQLGYCWNRFNPMLNENYQINFDNILEATEENLYKLINKSIELAKERDIYQDNLGNTYEIVNGGIVFTGTLAKMFTFKELARLYDIEKHNIIHNIVEFYAWKYLGRTNRGKFARVDSDKNIKIN